MATADDICRICYDGDSPENKLIHPCDCRGSLAFVHVDCLEEWVNRTESLVCQTCNKTYASRPSPWRKVVVNGCAKLTRNMAGSLLLHVIMNLLGFLLFIYMPGGYGLTVPILMLVCSFSCAVMLFHRRANGLLAPRWASMYVSMYLKNHFLPMIYFLGMVNFLLRAVLGGRLDDSASRFGCWAGLATYSVLLALSVVVSSIIRIDDIDPGLPTCHFYSRMCCLRLRQLVAIFFILGHSPRRLLRILFGRGIGYTQFILAFCRPHNLGFCDWLESSEHSSGISTCFVVDFSFGVFWCNLLIFVAVQLCKNVRNGRRRFRPRTNGGRRQSRSAWFLSLGLLIVVLISDYAILFNNMELLSNPLVVEWALVWTAQMMLSLFAFSVINASALRRGWIRTTEFVLRPFQSNVEFMSAERLPVENTLEQNLIEDVE